jgi:hypothetical protein
LRRSSPGARGDGITGSTDGGDAEFVGEDNGLHAVAEFKFA